jgi:hypothetical protein
MATGKLMLNYTFEENSIGFQKCCLGGKIINQDDVNSRLDTADDNFFNSCWRCFMKGHKINGQCDTDSCPVKYAHRRVVQTLFNISDALQEYSDLDLPYIKATEYTLDDIIEMYDEAITQAKTGPITGLDKIKNLFGGK